MSQHEEMQEMAEKAQLDFVKKVLGNPAELNKHDFEEVADSISEIIHLAQHVLHLPIPQIATQLVKLQQFAAYEMVEINLPRNISTMAADADNKAWRMRHRIKPKDTGYGEADPKVSDAEIFGILKPAQRLREN